MATIHAFSHVVLRDRSLRPLPQVAQFLWRRRIMKERNFVAPMLKWERLRVLQVLNEALVPFVTWQRADCTQLCILAQSLPYFSAARRQDGDAAAE